MRRPAQPDIESLRRRRLGRQLLVLLALVGISVAARLPTLDRPLAEHHEWLTATVVRNLEIWHADGALADGLQPIFSYPGAANKHIDNQSSGLADRTGNYYYTSYPVGGYVAPYAAFWALRVSPTVLGLQLFNLAAEAVVVLLLFGLVRRLLPTPRAGPAFAAATAYLFTAETLWYHSNAYMSDMLAQTAFVLTLWAAVLWFDPEASRVRRPALPAALLAFALTEWLSLFVGGTLVLYALVTRRRRIATTVVVGSSCGFAVGLTGWQFARIAGLRALGTASTAKYALRSGYGVASASESGGIGQQLATLARYYRAGYLPLIALATGLGLLAVVLAALSRRHPARPVAPGVAPRWAELRLVALLTTVPVLAHHAVFLDFSAQHDFAVLKAGFALSIGVGLGVGLVLRHAPGPRLRRAVAAVIAFGLIGSSGYSTRQYLRTERATATAGYQRVGADIRRQAGPDEVVFLRVPGATAEQVNGFLTPQVVLAAHRNIEPLTWTAEPGLPPAARELIQRNGTGRGVVFTLDPGVVHSADDARVVAVDRFVVG